MEENKEFMDLCRAYAEARNDPQKSGKDKNALYEACMEKGKALDMTRYAIEEAIEKCLEERMI
ncbi:MAG: hypothetical protein IJ631_04380 [Schwartzia sp.]|nr:hypothetical protein [Schwartzia sp. (in: firmicutes)]